MPQIIYIHPDAPAKPPVGDACNGCGVCCLAEPCPIGMLVSRKRHGACTALAWDDAQRRYRCGMMNAGAHWPRWAGALVQRWVRRVIAAGVGCDADLRASAFEAGGTGD